MAEVRDESTRYNLENYPAGTVFVVCLGNDTAYRMSLLDPEQALATVWPVAPGQGNQIRAASLESTSHIGSKAIEAVVKPRILPIEGDEGPVQTGRLICGHELVLQNARDGAGTTTYSGYPIERVCLDVPQ